jgi:hypothetical protein
MGFATGAQQENGVTGPPLCFDNVPPLAFIRPQRDLEPVSPIQKGPLAWPFGFIVLQVVAV